MVSPRDEPDSQRASQAASPCPLPWRDQRRNLVLFAACNGMQYLAAPVLYVGITQASLCDRLGADARTANLPGTAFFAMTAMPALLAWLSPRVAALQRNLVACYLICALMLAAMAVTVVLPVANTFKLSMVVLQGAVAGAAIPAAVALLWEVIGRGSEESRRGLALGLAFGLGPVLAVIGSLGQTCLLGGNFFGVTFTGVAYPWNFCALFGAGAPIVALAALFSRFLIVPAASQEPKREPVSEVAGLLCGLPLMLGAIALVQIGAARASDGLCYAGYLLAAGAATSLVYHFRAILSQRVLLLATLVTILVYAGNGIPSNMNLYSAEALGDLPEKYAGVQNTMRFGFKVVAGLVLGWLLTRTSPRAGVLATSALFLAAQLWAMFVTGPWYLLAFGIHGAGELIGVYAPNYIVSASRRDQLRRNMAFMTMLMVPAAPAGYLYGAIVDFVKTSQWTAFGLTSAALGFRLSFLVCALFILSGMVLAATFLPPRPRPEDSMR